MRKTKIINLFGGPGVGKSTTASGLFYSLKQNGIVCDSPYEFPKQVAWEENYSQISDQLYIFANQHRGIVRSYGKVDYIIMDSPLLLSLIYKNGYINDYPASFYKNSFDSMVMELFSSYDNINILLENTENKFEFEGRLQNYNESLIFDNKIKKMLDDFVIPYKKVMVGENTIKEIIEILNI